MSEFISNARMIFFGSTTILGLTPARLIRVGPESKKPNPVIVPDTSLRLRPLVVLTIWLEFLGPHLVPFLRLGLVLGL